MAGRLRIDEQALEDVRGCHLVVEAKSRPISVRRRPTVSWYHWALMALILLCAVTVSDFFATFLLLGTAVIVSLVAFVVLIQLPIRFLANRWRARRTQANCESADYWNAPSNGI